MLILIAGITGNIGQYAARYALSEGHQVRGLGRSPGKLDTPTRDQLESFITSNAYHDVAALDKGVAGVDAVLCAYGGMPELHLEGQLLLLRAAERAGVKRYLAASWNYDWRKIPIGSEPVYEGARMFHVQVSISSNIKPLHIFSGMLAEVFFGIEGQSGFTPKDFGVWDPFTKPKSMDIWGTGDEIWQFTTEEDAGKWGVEVLTAPGAEKGGFVNVCSFETSLNDLRKTYETVKGTKVKVNRKGEIADLDRLGEEGREKLGNAGFWDWHRYVFHANCVKGVWNLEGLENQRFPRVNATSLEEFLEAHPSI